LALIPTVTVAVFSVLTINVGLEGWFSNVCGRSCRIPSMRRRPMSRSTFRSLSGTGGASPSFVETQKRQNVTLSDGDVRQALGRIQGQVERGLTEVFVVDGSGEIRARGARSYEFGYEQPSDEDFRLAEAEGIRIVEDWDNDEFRALIPLPEFLNRYLYVTRAVDGEILALLDETQATVDLYRQLDANKGRLLFEFGLLYLGFALILIVAAVWLGLWFAEGLSKPVGRLLAPPRGWARATLMCVSSRRRAMTRSPRWAGTSTR
jgi:two-component system nitrogen regulation sensor histidine kinase NtrY